MTYDVLIIGGGVAGCSAAIQLAGQGRRVLMLEKQRYPVHKLCGEFLSVEVQALFGRLGVESAIGKAGATPIDRVRVTTMGGGHFDSVLPGTALGLSRYRLDALLFEQARAAGATVQDGVAVRSVEGSLEEGFVVRTAGDTFEARMVLGAYGKRGLIDRKLDRAFLHRKSPFVAFKAHYEGLDLASVIELHAFPGGYCGLSRVEQGRINVCWIARDAVLKDAGGDPETMITQAMGKNLALAQRLNALERVSERFIAVSQVMFEPKGLFANDVCMIGDTGGMIAPLCGDGMAMALRSAELVTPRASNYLNGALTASRFRQEYEHAWHREFGLRMRLGRWMHHGYGHPMLARLGVGLCRKMPGLGRWLIRKTREVA